MEGKVKRFRIGAGLFVLAACLFMGVRPASADIILDFSNLPDTTVTFGGGSFNFTNDGSGYQFKITGQQGGVGDSVGLEGYLAPGGPFIIGPITTNGIEQDAVVTGNSVLHITDNSSPSVDLIGAIQWDQITTLGSDGIINLNGFINVFPITYSGTNSDLSALAAIGFASDSVTFQFAPGVTLTQLDTTGGSTSYSGTIFASTNNVNNNGPEPASIGFIAISAVTLLSVRRRSRPDSPSYV